jgi:hypothetical protein
LLTLRSITLGGLLRLKRKVATSDDIEEDDDYREGTSKPSRKRARTEEATSPEVISSDDEDEQSDGEDDEEEGAEDENENGDAVSVQSDTVLDDIAD